MLIFFLLEAIYETTAINIGNIIGILLAVAYFTLVERKVLAAMQRRKGPNAIGPSGLLQPMADGLKLIGKERILPHFSINPVYIIAPMISMKISFVAWSILPNGIENIINIDHELGILIFFCFTSLGSYGTVLAGWASFSRFAVFGALRGIAQLISYEVVFLITMLSPAVLVGNFSYSAFGDAQQDCWLIVPNLFAAILFIVLILAETNRTPFDLPEAESELVSGFNVEYSSTLFALFSLAEYNSILMMSVLFTILFLGGWSHGQGIFEIKVIFICILIVNIRALLPRYRYDQLMSMCWFVFLPLSISIFIFTFGLAVYFEIFPISIAELFGILSLKFDKEFFEMR